MTYIKDNYSKTVYEAIFRDLWVRMWEQHWDISKPEKMIELLIAHVGADDARAILAAASTPEVKSKLNATTQKVLDAGAYGCPFMLVTNSKGTTEPFFGSDRQVSSSNPNSRLRIANLRSSLQVSLHVGVSRLGLVRYSNSAEVESVVSIRLATTYL